MDLLRPLEDLGLPLGPARPRDPAAISLDAARRALESIGADLESLDAAAREPLLAWLCGFRQHWPDTWASRISPIGDVLIARLRQTPFDHDRYLKLRRIAIENLATLI